MSLILMLVLGGLCPVLAAEKKSAAAVNTELKVHPLVFSMIQGWLSDGESPVVTEINIDAVALSKNQFDPESVKQEEGWTRCPGTGGTGFLRYRVLKSKGEQFTVEYQENGGGSLTLAATVECTLAKRTFEIDGKQKAVRVLRVLSYHSR